MSNFNSQLKMLRQEIGLSQQDLADKIGVSKSSINMYERGEREPGIETLKRMSIFFNVDMDYLLGKNNIPKRQSLKIGARMNRSIAHNIQHHREQANLTKKQFADLLGVDETVVADLENGQHNLEKEMLYKICDVLQLIPGNIMPRDDDLTEDEEYLLSRRQMPSPENLTEGEQVLLNLFRRVPEEQQQLVLQMIRAALGNQG